jgi:hypothetical protein
MIMKKDQSFWRQSLVFSKKNYELNFSPGESKKNPARRKTGDKSR